VRILHLSDLHVTSPNTSFLQVWARPGAALTARGLGTKAFDFVVVSGDLTQRASDAEYKALKKFLRDLILPLLKVRQVERIILVPGNHDVDWTCTVGAPVQVGLEAKKLTFAKELQQAQYEPERSDLRIVVGELGHLDVLRLDRTKYPSRFARVQKFFDDFYPNREPPRFRRFDLGSSDRGSHWSAHVFPEDRVAFYGFSSCSDNDQYWTGATINPEAVANAAIHAQKHARGCLRIAVWHHGLDTGRGHPDRLTLQDINLLKSQNFSIGFHGHTHRDAHAVFTRPDNDTFVVVSTGSLAAGARERPELAGNQFSVVDIHSGHVRVEIYEAGADNAPYQPKKPTYLPLRADPNPSERVAEADTHIRTWTLDEFGIADVNVELTRLKLSAGPVTLALLEPPFCNVAGDANAKTAEGLLEVKRTDLADGRVRFDLIGRPASGGEIPWLKWHYALSNALALTVADIRMRDTPAAMDRADGVDGCPHTVRIQVNHLEMHLKFPKDYPARPDSLTFRVQRWIEDPAVPDWRDDDTERESKFDAKEDERTYRHFSVRVASPRLGYRYYLGYAPEEEGPELGPDLSRTFNDLVDRCQNLRADEDPSAATLTEALEGALARAFQVKSLESSLFWIGHLWCPQSKGLTPCFGRFPSRSWATTFAWGEGIVGHALRFARVVHWRKFLSDNTDDLTGWRASLLYRPVKKRLGPSIEYDWIVCIPITTGTDDTPVGVIGFAGQSIRASTMEKKLIQYADASFALKGLPRSGQYSDKNVQRLHEDLFTEINVAFWRTLSRLYPDDGAIDAVLSTLDIPVRTKRATPRSRPS